MATDNIALARRLVDEVWNQGNYGRVKDLVSTDHVLRDPLSREARGLDAFTQYVRMQRTAFPDLSFTVDEVFGAGDRILVRLARAEGGEALVIIDAKSGAALGTIDLLPSNAAEAKP